MKKLIIGMFTLGFTATALFALYPKNANASVEKQIDESTNILAQQIQTEINNKTKLSLSSNPYDYIKDSPEYNDIVKIGYKAFPVLEKKIDDSEGSGLFDYIYAIAIEEIAKVDLKENDSTTWTTGDEFSEKWKVKLDAIPNEVDTIANSDQSNDDKITSLIKLGLPAVPFILDQIESGKTELFSAIPALVTDSANISKSVNPVDEIQWVKDNKAEFDDLRKYVLSR
ncbi:hypothetical protein JI735_10560 [Paenibacillus sonchi]|uniref:Uncharacterized protein n=1 Tax=Paenibacillus sonchi TaxID=373687 RepID=A0A974PGQ9_9BACL|nr:hypothetical protein [Paenibacillus sonchi]QQZ62917.1 hypothetical protein JI735_10560 [Paenibacillus sonchi]